MQSTASSPASWPRLYADLMRDARQAEALGFDSLWVAEHRFWYDGWCPAPLVAAAAALGATQRLRVGTAMHLLPQHDPARTARAVASLDAISRGRFRLGVGLGYRDEEFDGLGLARTHRGRLMDAALDVLQADLAAGHGPAGQPSAPGIWVGGMARAALARAARRGLALLLPPTLHPEEVRETLAYVRSEAHAVGLPLGRVGMVKDLWVTDGSAAERRAYLDSVDNHYREYAGSWWQLHGQQGFTRPDLLDRQMARTRRTAVVGPPDKVVARLSELADAGVDTLALHVNADVTRDRYATMMSTVAETVVPALRDATCDDRVST